MLRITRHHMSTESVGMIPSIPIEMVDKWPIPTIPIDKVDKCDPSFPTIPVEMIPFIPTGKVDK